jgi:hypothetical protein
MIEAQIILENHEETLARHAREDAARVSLRGAWSLAGEIAAQMPHTESTVTRTDSNTSTETWKRGAADWQRPSWTTEEKNGR